MIDRRKCAVLAPQNGDSPKLNCHRWMVYSEALSGTKKPRHSNSLGGVTLFKL